MRQKLWHEYVRGKQTATQLGEKYGRCRQWISGQLRKAHVEGTTTTTIDNRAVVVVADATFFSWGDGILCFRDPHARRFLTWKEIHSETPGQYQQLRLELEQRGIFIKAIVLDGKRGVREVFHDIPVQMCQFHQAMIMTRYLTTRPNLEAGKELRQIALVLKRSTEAEFERLLADWYEKWNFFLKERTTDSFTGKWRYTHRRIRAAYRSLKTNLPFLFTYQRYPDLKMPNTCNSIDGSNTTLKNLLRNHRGLCREQRLKMTSQILESQAPKN